MSFYTPLMQMALLFFLKDRSSITELMNELNIFSNFSGLKPNKTKCEIVGISVLNGVQVALCGMKCVNLNNETVKILHAHFSYNKIFPNIFLK